MKAYAERRFGTLLLVDDNPADQELARRALERGAFDCDLRIVADGEEALEYLHESGRYADKSCAPRPDLVLLDLNLPKVGGLQVLENMKSDSQLSLIPVVVFTTSRHEADVASSYRLGCNAFMGKPMDVSEFMTALRKIGDYWLKLVVLPKQ